MINIPENVQNAISYASIRTGVNEDLLTGLAYIESNFKPGVINGKQLSSTQVSGLFQITGATWKNVRKDGVAKTLDINEQAYTAALLVQKLSREYDGNRDLIAIAYNAGEGVSNQLKGKQITYQAIKNAVQKFSGQSGFGPEKVQEVFQYPQKLSAAMGQQCTITGSVPINPIFQTNNKNNKVTPIDPTGSNKFNDKFSILENFTINKSGKVLDTFNKKVEATTYMKNTSLVKRLRNGIARNKTKNTQTHFYGKKAE